MSERVRQSIAISGINTAEPCHAVADGAMGDICNLRYKDGAFTGVYEPKIIAPISADNGYDIIYTMDCIRGMYIAIIDAGIHLVQIIDGSIVSKQGLVQLPAEYENLKLSSFGSVLYVNYYHDGNLNENCFVFKDDVFTAFDMGAIAPPEFTIELSGETLLNGTQSYMPVMDVETKTTGEVVKTALYNANISKLHDKGYFVGFTFIAVAYKMFDGSIVKCGQIYGVSSYVQSHHTYGDGLSLEEVTDKDKNKIKRYCAVIVGAKAVPNITVPDHVLASGMIKSVVILASRPNPLFEYDKIHEKFGTHGSYDSPSGIKTCGNNCILNEDAINLKQPLYEVAEMNLDSITQIELNYPEHFKDIESLPVYKASFSNHATISGGRFEYNNRLHAYNVKFTPDSNLKVSPFNTALPYPNHLYGWGDDVWVALRISIVIDGIDCKLVKHLKVKTVTLSHPDRRYMMIDNLITYPDARATTFEIIIGYRRSEYDTGVYAYSYPLKPSFENNCAYTFIEVSRKSNSVNPCGLIEITHINNVHISGDVLPPESAISVMQTNKLYVSALNNPFFTPAINIYTIGESSSMINSICTATEQITETKFGLFPLYVFTDRAIHALEVGSGEIVYQRVIGISNDTKLNDTTTVGAANLVFFISARGVMAVEGRRITCISEPLNQYVGMLPSKDLFSIYQTSAKLAYNSVESELIVYNPNYDYAYIYSMTGRYWSRRDWTAKDIGYQSEIVIKGKGIASAWIEDKTKPSTACMLESRAIKLSTLEFKRLETLIARVSCGVLSDYEVKLYGSNDLQSWTALSTANSQPIIRRTSASYKFFKIRLDCDVNDYFAITNFDAEYYLRFVRRLR